MSVSEDYVRWDKTVRELCYRHKALHDIDRRLLSLYTLVRFVLCNKQYLNMVSRFHRVKMYHGAIKHIERIYDCSNVPRTYHLLMDELIGQEYVYAHGGTEHSDEMWQAIVSLRSIYVRYVDEKYILVHLPLCLTNIVVDYMV